MGLGLARQRTPARLARLIAPIVAIGFAISGCAGLPSGTYRFQTEFERDPMAFREGQRGEPLVINVKLQNLSDQAVWIGGKSSAEAGVYLGAQVNSSSGFLSKPSVITGLRGGMRIHSQSEATSELWFDRHAAAVTELAEIGPPLLHLDPDNVRSSLGLFANEAAFNVSIPVRWDLVPRSPLMIPIDVELTINIAYVGPNGEKFIFPQPLLRRITGYLVNGRRYATGSMPAPNGPVSGEFKKVSP
jgi:hypothetical protein